MKKGRLFATAVAGFLLFALSGPALAQSSAPEHVVVFSAGPAGAPRTVVATGAFDDIGNAVQSPAGPGQGNPTWVFPDGSVHLHISYTATSDDNDEACLQTTYLSGTWQITAGTGAFAGATGGGTFTTSNRMFFTRTTDGCGDLYLAVAVARFDGNVSMP